MKAIVCPKYGSSDVLQLKEVEKPVPRGNEVLIKIHATTVNRSDCAMLRAKPFPLMWTLAGSSLVNLFLTVSGFPPCLCR